MIKKVKTLLKVKKNLLYQRVYIHPSLEKEIVDRFHVLYYDSKHLGKTTSDTFWLGARTLKCPLDLWIYQEIIHAVKPDLIVESGTAYGGSALYLASICDLIGRGKIVSIDIANRNPPKHERITYLVGSSIAPETFARVSEIRAQSVSEGPVMVILDSDHKKDHVLEEMRLYSDLVTLGSYLIVEDTNINGHPVEPEYGPGPMEAVHEFLRENKNFVIDETKGKFYLTFNPDGYLKRTQ